MPYSSAYKPWTYLSSKAFGWDYLRESLCAGQKKVKETTDIIKRNENIYLKKNEENVKAIQYFSTSV